MRTHGWGGDPPATDAEAVERIVAGAVECVAAHGSTADVAKVAQRLGVTRQTVYRYFPTKSALFEQVADRARESLIGKVAERVSGIGDPADAVVEVVMYCLVELPRSADLSFIAAPARSDALIVSESARRIAADVLADLPIDLGQLAEEHRLHLAEHMLRLLQGLILDPSTAGRDEAELRRFLDACLRPCLHPVTIRS